MCLCHVLAVGINTSQGLAETTRSSLEVEKNKFLEKTMGKINKERKRESVDINLDCPMSLFAYDVIRSEFPCCLCVDQPIINRVLSIVCIFLSVRHSLSPSVCLSVCPSACLSVSPCLSLSLHLSFSLSLSLLPLCHVLSFFSPSLPVSFSLPVSTSISHFASPSPSVSSSLPFSAHLSDVLFRRAPGSYAHDLKLIYSVIKN